MWSEYSEFSQNQDKVSGFDSLSTTATDVLSRQNVVLTAPCNSLSRLASFESRGNSCFLLIFAALLLNQTTSHVLSMPTSYYRTHSSDYFTLEILLTVL